MAYICHDVDLLWNVWLRQQGLSKPAELSLHYPTLNVKKHRFFFPLSLQWELIVIVKMAIFAL